MKFRKKPVVIEAAQFQPHELPWPEGVERYTKEALEDVGGTRQTRFGWRIQTLEGPHEVTPGDFIITGVKGERYPCKPDIFLLTYDPCE